MRNTKRYKIFDAHCDTLTKLYSSGESLSNNKNMVSAKCMKKYLAYIQTFACFIEDNDTNPFEKAVKFAKLFDKEMQNHGIAVVQNRYDIKNIFTQNLTGAILSLENGKGIGSDIDNLDILHRLGYRLVTLTWNGQNLLGGGVDADIGLTDFGKKAIRKMQSLNIVIDLSHISKRGFFDCLGVIDKPFICSHSNVESVHGHKRNLSDSQIKEVIKRKSVIGLNFYPEFINGKNSASIDELINHALRILDLGGENNIGIGSDFDGIRYTVSGLKNNGTIYRFLDKLRDFGVNDSIIEKISYKNLARVFCEIL